jgi:hypothetical protein
MHRRFVFPFAALVASVLSTTTLPSPAEDTPYREWDETISQAQAKGRISATDAQSLQDNLGKLRDEQNQKDSHGTALPIWHQAEVDRLKMAVARIAPPPKIDTSTHTGRSSGGSSRTGDRNGSNRGTDNHKFASGQTRSATYAPASGNSPAMNNSGGVLMDVAGVSAAKTANGSVCVTAWGKATINGKAELRLGVRSGNNQSIEAILLPVAGSSAQNLHFWKESITLAPDRSCVYVTVQGRNKSLVKCLQL